MLKTALLVLTMTGGGQVRVTLSETENMAACGKSREMVTSILKGAEIKVIKAICGPSALRLTPFEHGLGPEAEIHKYQVMVEKSGKFRVTPLAKGATCTPTHDADPAIYCARSSQAVAKP